MRKTLALLLLVALASSTACRTAQVSEAGAVEDRGDFVIVSLRYTESSEVAAIINELLAASREAAGRRRRSICALGPPPWPDIQPRLVVVETQVVAILETNSIMIRASAEDRPRVVELISRLDTDPSEIRQRARR